MIANFRSQARVVDLLGREQIADSPTAIGELFKNALDAGASQAWVNWNEEADLLEIRDDGLGMRTSDVTDKWLVLATDSSHRSEKDNADWAEYATNQQKKWLKEHRYGEKGIGRLSVAILGRLGILWTVWGKGSQKTGTLCVVHWNMFQHPRKLFEDLPIPIQTFTEPPTVSEIETIIQEFHQSPEIRTLLSDQSWDKSIKNEIAEDLSKPLHLGDSQETFLPWENGTTFYLRGLTDQIPELFRKANKELPAEEDRSSDFLKSYHAFDSFWNPFHDHHGKRDFKITTTKNRASLSNTNRFWQPEDFSQTDHHIRITVSKDGFAEGTITNYKKPPIPYQKQLIDLPKYSTSPGEFLVELGYIQGQKSDSPLPDDIFREGNTRLEHAGGFSIYLNDVRIQPYGSIDSDFAGFENRRLKNAGRYYFASRRMFGGVFLPSFDKTRLREKAGREGFINNGAKRGLKLWLENLFIDLADSHFGSKAERPDKEESKQRRKNKKQAEERLKKEKKEYLKQAKASEKKLAAFVGSTKRKLQHLNQLIASEANSDPGTHLEEFETNLEALKKLGRDLANMPSDTPVGVVLSDGEQEQVDRYLSERSRIRHSLDKRILQYSEKLDDASLRLRNRDEHLAWVRERFHGYQETYRQKIEELVKPLRNQQKSIAEKIGELEENHFLQLKEIFDKEVGNLTPEKMVRDRSGDSDSKLERALHLVERHYQEDSVRQIHEISEELAHLLEGSSATVLVQEYADELNRLKDRESFLIEMAQLGIITEAATHEHDNHVEVVRRKIGQLKKLIEKKHQPHLDQLLASFDIVDARMRMFDPLIRSKGVLTPTLEGLTILKFLQEHFSSYFENGLIDVSENFLTSSLPSVKQPVVLGAIYNLVHNALYWCHKGNGAPKIQLAGGSHIVIISDSGPGISPTDLKRIYDPGFTRRPYGRGFGLFIAREALKAIGYELSYLTEEDQTILEGANFAIFPADEIETNE